MTAAEKFATLVKEHRLRLGMDVAELAKVAGVHETTIRNIERGQGLRWSTIVIVSRALGIEPSADLLP